MTQVKLYFKVCLKLLFTNYIFFLYIYVNKLLLILEIKIITHRKLVILLFLGCARRMECIYLAWAVTGEEGFIPGNAAPALGLEAPPGSEY